MSDSLQQEQLQLEEDNPFKNIDLRRFILVLVKKWRAIVVFSLLLLIIGLIFGLRMRGKSFEATTVVLRTETSQGVLIGEGNHFELPTLNMETLIDTIKLPSNIFRIRDRLGLQIDIHDFAGKITLSKAPNSNLIMITGVGDSQQQAVNVANVSSEVFVEFLLNLRQQQAKKALQKLNSLVESAEKEFEVASEEVSDFRKKHGIVSMDLETELSLEQISSLESQIEETRIELNSISKQKRTVGTVGAGGESYGAQRLSSLQKQLDELNARYTDENPLIAKLKAEMNEVRKTAIVGERGRLGTARSILAGKLSTLKRQKNELELKLSNLSDAEKGYVGVQQKYIFAKQMVQNLRARREEARAIVKDTTGEFKIIEKAVPPKYPQKSKAKFVVVAVPVAGFLFIILVILAMEFFNPRIMSAREVFHRCDLKILGQHLRDPYGPKNVPYREIQVYKPVVSALTVQKRLEGHKLIGFFATLKNSGLTTVTQNLANAHSIRGLRVLYFDLDIHAERKNEYALKNLIDGSATLDQMIQHGIEGDADFLSAGFSHPGDLEVLGDFRLADILENIKSRYDLIFVDTPPAFEYMQTIELVPMLDALVFVVRAGHTKKDHLERVVRLLRDIERPVLGAFIADAVPFLARRHEIVMTSLYRKIEVGRGFVERIILGKLLP